MKPLIVVHHVPKTSGSTMRVGLAENLGFERVYWHVADGNIYNDVNHLKSLGDQILVVGGHMPFAAIEKMSFGRKIIRFSMVRDPVSLLISAMNYVKVRPDHPNFTDIPPDNPAILETSFYKRYSQTQCNTITSYVCADKAIERINSYPYVITTNDNVDNLFYRAMEIIGETINQPLRRMNVGNKDYSWFNENLAREILATGADEDRRLFEYVSSAHERWIDTIN